jgi:SAM-dependent methyltransferase
MYYAHLDFNAPLSEARADAIAARLARHAPGTALDVGCGWAELLQRVLLRSPDTLGTGVDTDEPLLDRGRAAAASRGLGSRLVLTRGSGSDLSEAADLVLCVGSSHALSEDLSAALAGLFALVRPGGRLLLGEGFWEPHGPVDESLVWDDLLALPSYAGLVDVALEAGFRLLWAERANDDEWDAFESGFLADVEEWLLTSPEVERADTERENADDHRRRWLHGYRNGLGFAYLTLGRPATAGTG